MPRSSAAVLAGLLATGIPLGSDAQSPAADPTLASRAWESPSGALNVRAGLRIEGVPLVRALTELHQRTAIPLLFSPTILPPVSVSCNCEDVSAGEALTRMLEGTGLEFADHGGQVVVGLRSVDAVPTPAAGLVTPVTTARRPRTSPGTAIVAQNGTVTGRVVDAQTLQPIGTAQVFIEGTQIGALTRADGMFMLVNVPAGTHTVQAQLIGFRTQSQQITVANGQSVTVNFEMAREALALDEVIVTGTAGGTQRRAVGNVVERLDVAALSEVSPATTVEQTLGARVPGMLVMPGSGQAGGDAGAIRIRGSSSSALPNDPIIYVDGIRINSDRAYAGSMSAISRLNDINPADIASIEIIKGPAAATLYGTEASNGVIQIITKRGVTGAPAFDASLEVGASWMNDPEGKIPTNYGIHPVTKELISQHIYRSEREVTGKDLFQYGPVRRGTVSVRGGTDLIRYYASANHSYQEGIVDWNWDEKSSGRMSIGVTPSPSLSINVNGSYMSGATRDPGSIWGDMLWGRPNSYEGATGIANPLRGWRVNPPEFWRDGREDITGVDRTSLGVEIRHQPWEWLTNRLVAGMDLTDQMRSVLNYVDPDSPFGGVQTQEGYKELDRVETRLRTLDYAGTVRVTPVSKLTSATSWGMQYYNKQDWRLRGIGRNFTSPSLTTVAAAAVTDSQEHWLENSTLGVYLQEQLDWDQRIFVTGAVRVDDNSAFGTNFDMAIYPKFSATWVVHEEPFWARIPRLSDYVTQFRLRGAWGAAGRQPDAFAATRLYMPVTGPNDQPTVAPRQFGNPDLGPERGEELELGFDASGLEDRVDLNFTAYWKKTTDAIVARPLAGSTGFPNTQFINVGQISNWGTETQLNLRVLTQNPVRWDMTLGFTTMNNRVDDLGGMDRIPVRRAASHVEGYPLASQFHPKVLSAEFVKGNRGPVKNMMCDGGAGPDGRQMGGAPVPCSQAPLVYYGPGEPTWNASVSSTLNLFENWRLYVQADGRGGHLQAHDLINGAHTTYTNTLASIEQTDPIYMAYRQIRRDPISLFDAGFARLREVSLAYTFPETLAGRFGASRASVSVAARNLALLWRAQTRMPYGGMHVPDPEQGTPSVPFGGEIVTPIPPLTHALVTLNVTF